MTYLISAVRDDSADQISYLVKAKTLKRSTPTRARPVRSRRFEQIYIFNTREERKRSYILWKKMFSLFFNSLHGNGNYGRITASNSSKTVAS
jgi:hypothetical protein